MNEALLAMMIGALKGFMESRPDTYVPFTKEQVDEVYKNWRQREIAVKELLLAIDLRDEIRLKSAIDVLRGE